jgi:penicillin-binding protein 1A
MPNDSPPTSGIDAETWESLSPKDRDRIDQAVHELARTKALAAALFHEDMRESHGEEATPWEATDLRIRAYYLKRAFDKARPHFVELDDMAWEQPKVVRAVVESHHRREHRLSLRVKKAAKIFSMVAAGALVLLIAWLMVTAPLSQSLQPIAAPSVVVLAADGQPIARRGAVRDAPVDVTALPPHVGQAFIAIEDRRFFRHVGIDPWGVARAMFRNWRAGTVREGGSTISQQLAKTSFTGGDRTMGRKAQEALIALWLEAWLSKEEILSRYLSNVYFGNNIYGLRAAARFYFNIPPEELTLEQSAILAAVVNAPNRLAPNRNLEGARRRSRLVTRAMTDIGYISERERSAARPARLRLSPSDNVPTGTYFADWILAGTGGEEQEDYGERQIQTTLDPALQRAAIRTFRQAQLGGHQAALVAMRPDGQVVAMLGGRDYARSPFNRATQARRQPGSTFKLFVYLAALRAGMTPDTPVEDRPITIGTWTPRNYDGRYRGSIPLRDAFALSSNVAAVRLTNELGTAAVTRAARDLGITAPMPDDPSIALGTAGVSLLQMTAAYAAVAADRYPVIPHGVLAKETDGGLFGSLFGGLIQPADGGRSDPAFEEMRDLLRAAVEGGTGRAAGLSVVTYGKTGTTQDYRDALFIGFAGDLVVGVWVGNDDNRPMTGITGGGLPARIWRAFVSQAIGVPPAPSDDGK